MSDDKEKPQSKEILADDLQRGWDSTDRITDRLERYSNLKESTIVFTEWAKGGGVPQFTRADTKLFRKVDSCGSYLIFRNYLLSNRTRLIGACSCKEHLICAFCAARRGVRNARAYQERVNALQQQTPSQKLMFVTFTVKNGPNLIERYLHLKNSMQAFLKRRSDALRKPNRQSSFVPANGGVFAFEFKRGSGENLWHPHIHMLVLVDDSAWLNIEDVKNEWLQVTGDSSVVNIEPCTNDAAFLEVFAYALKFSEMEHKDRWLAFSVLKGERLISSFGSFRGVEVPDSIADDLLDSDEPWVDLIFRYRTYQGYDVGTKIGSSS